MPIAPDHADDTTATGSPVAIPRVLHQTWRTADLPDRLAAFRRTWLRHHPDWDHRLWTDADLRVFVAEAAPDMLAIFDAYREPICRVDLARYLILERFGGVYADLDMECLRPIDPLIAGRQLVVGREPEAHDRLASAVERGMTRFLCPSVIASVPGHPLWTDVRRSLIEAQSETNVLEATGPFLLTRAAAGYRGEAPVTVVGPELFYPLDKDAAWDGALFDIERWEATARTAYAIHHWDGSWFRRHPATAIDTPPRTLTVHVSSGVGIARLEGDVGPGRLLRLPRERIADGASPALVSCLMVTRGRAPLAAVAIECFRRQTWPNRELVIVDDDPDESLARRVEALGDRSIRMIRVREKDGALGDLRNRSIAEARGAYVCQWDDDDLQDPLRIELQMEALTHTSARACFLRRWLHWWPGRDRLAVSSRRIWEGSMLAEKSVVPPYPSVRRGEDTAPTIALCQSHRVAHLDAPRLSVYVVHGRNAHHAGHYENMWAWATARFDGARYRRVRDELARRLPIEAYAAALTAVDGASTVAVAPDDRAPAASLEDVRLIARASASTAPARAIRGWEATLASDPDDLEALAGRAAALLRLRRANEAEAAYAELARRHADRPDGFLGLARVALQRDDSRRALTWCTEGGQRPSGNVSALGERGRILLQLDRPDEADAAFAEMRRRAPGSGEGHVGGALAATHHQDWPTALARWREVWARFRNPAAPIEIVTALVHLGRVDDAEAFLVRLAAGRADPALRLSTELRLARLLHDWERIHRVLEAADPEATESRRQLGFRVDALLIRGEHARAIALCEQRAHVAGSRPLLIRALLAADARDQAHVRLLALADGKANADLPIELMPELMAAVRNRDGLPAAQDMAHRIRRRRDVRLEIRIAALFEAQAADSLVAIGDPAAALPRFAPGERLVADLLGPDDGAALDHERAMRRACAAHQAIRRRHRSFHPDVMTSIADALAVADRLAGAIEHRTPLALVRLGDGEGNFLPYHPDRERHRRADQASIQRIWWSSTPLPEDDTIRIERMLAEAIRSADMVGIPDAYRFARLFRARVPPGQTSRGALAVVEQFAGMAPPPDGRPLGRPEQAMTGAHVHNAFEHWRLWDLLLAPVGSCAVIAGHADAADHVRRRFSIAVDRVYEIPGERKYRPGTPGRAGPPHYPDQFEALRARLAVARPGEVFLVAAGVLGKIYCAWIRAKGGIAIDVGSALDHWCGQRTRTTHEAAYFRAPPGLLEAYAARPALDLAYPRLQPATRASLLLAGAAAAAPA